MSINIQFLPSDVRSKLRSYVTITSPLQAVQELVLNAVDAEATSIAVRVDFSIFRLQVVDNGCGISKGNLALVGERQVIFRYATSKFNSTIVKHNLPRRQFGYRGEALASLVDVSGYLEVISRCNSVPSKRDGQPKDLPEQNRSGGEEEHRQNSLKVSLLKDNYGDDLQHRGEEIMFSEIRDQKSALLFSPHLEDASDATVSTAQAKIDCASSNVATCGLGVSNNTFVKVFSFGNGGEVEQEKHLRPSSGTTVTIQDFMYCMPIRRKMIKEAVDLENIHSWLEGMVLIHPKVAFSLRNDKSAGCLLLQSKKCGTMMGAVQHMFGDDLADSLAEVLHSLDSICVTGYISTRVCPSKSIQFVYINKRLVLRTRIHKFMNKLLSKCLVVNSKRNVYYYNKNSKSNRSPSSPPKGVQLYGIFILNITCANEECDILLDPTRTLVEFRNWSRVWSCLEGAVVKFGQEENISISLEDASGPADNAEPNSAMKVIENIKMKDELPIVLRSQVKLKAFCHKRKNARDASTEPPVKKYSKLIGISDVSNAVQSHVVRRPKTKSANPVIENKNANMNPDRTADKDIGLTKECHKSSAATQFKNSLEQFRKELQQVPCSSCAYNNKTIARHKSTASCTSKEHTKGNEHVVRASKDHQMSSSSESSDDEIMNKDNATFSLDGNENRGKLIQPLSEKVVHKQNGSNSRGCEGRACAGPSTALCGSSIQEFCLQYKKNVDERHIIKQSSPLQSTLESPSAPPVSAKHLADSSVEDMNRFSELHNKPFIKLGNAGNSHIKVPPVAANSVADNLSRMVHPFAGRRSKVVDIRVPLGQLFNKTLSSTLGANVRKEQTRIKTYSTLETFRFKCKSSSEDLDVCVKNTGLPNCLDLKTHPASMTFPSSRDDGNISFYFDPVILDSKPSHVRLERGDLEKSEQQADYIPNIEGRSCGKTESRTDLYPLVEEFPISSRKPDPISVARSPNKDSKAVFQAGEERHLSIARDNYGEQLIERTSADTTSLGQQRAINDILPVPKMQVKDVAMQVNMANVVLPLPILLPRNIFANQSSFPSIGESTHDMAASTVLQKDMTAAVKLKTFSGVSGLSDAPKLHSISTGHKKACQVGVDQAETRHLDNALPQPDDQDGCSICPHVLDASFLSHRCYNIHRRGDTQLLPGNDTLDYDSHPYNARQQQVERVGKCETVKNKDTSAINLTSQVGYEKMLSERAITLIGNPPMRGIVASDVSVHVTQEDVSVVSVSVNASHDIKTVLEYSDGSSNCKGNNKHCPSYDTRPFFKHSLDADVGQTSLYDCVNSLENISAKDTNVSELSHKQCLAEGKLLIPKLSLSITPFMVFLEMNLVCSDSDVLASNSDSSLDFDIPDTSFQCPESRSRVEKPFTLDSDQSASTMSTKQVFDSGSTMSELVPVSTSTTSSASSDCVSNDKYQKYPVLQALAGLCPAEKSNSTHTRGPHGPSHSGGTGELMNETLLSSSFSVVPPSLLDQRLCFDLITSEKSSYNIQRCGLNSLEHIDCTPSCTQIAPDTPTCNSICDLLQSDTMGSDQLPDKITNQPSGNLISQTQSSRADLSQDSLWLTQQSHPTDLFKNKSDIISGSVSVSIEDGLKLPSSHPSIPPSKVINKKGFFSTIMFGGKVLKTGRESQSYSQKSPINDISANTNTLAGKLFSKQHSRDFYNPLNATLSGSSLTVNVTKVNLSNTESFPVPVSQKNSLKEWKEAKDHQGQVIYINLRSGNSSYVRPQPTDKNGSDNHTSELPDPGPMGAPVQTSSITNEPGSAYQEGLMKSSASNISREFSSLGRERLSLSSKLALNKKLIAKCATAPPTPPPVVLYDDMQSNPNTLQSARKKDLGTRVPNERCSMELARNRNKTLTECGLDAAIDEFNKETDAMSLNNALYVPCNAETKKVCSQPLQNHPAPVNSKQSTLGLHDTGRNASVAKIIAAATSFTREEDELRPVEDVARLLSNQNQVADCRDMLVNPEASNNAEQIVRDICAKAGMSGLAMDPDVLKLDNAWAEAVGPRTSKNVSGDEENAYKFTKDMLKTCRVLGQLDRKFIVCALDYTRHNNDNPGSRSPVQKYEENSNDSHDCLDRQTNESFSINHAPTVPLLVVFDQHAVHERIRLEAILESNYIEVTDSCNSSSRTVTSNVGVRKVLKSWPVFPVLELNFSESDIRIMEEYRAEIDSFGLVFEKTSSMSSTVRFTRLPMCLFPRSVVTNALAVGATEDTCPPEDDLSTQQGEGQSIKVAANHAQQSALERPPDKSADTAKLFKDPSSQFARRWRRYRGRLVQTVVQQVCEGIRHTRTPPCCLPQPLLDALHTQACRGAIKFGQRLSPAQCRSLLSALSRCALPFQCAHGRPSLVPLCDLAALDAKRGRARDKAPNLKKLQKMMRQNPSP